MSRGPHTYKNMTSSERDYTRERDRGVSTSTRFASLRRSTPVAVAGLSEGQAIGDGGITEDAATGNEVGAVTSVPAVWDEHSTDYSLTSLHELIHDRSTDSDTFVSVLMHGNWPAKRLLADSRAMDPETGQMVFGVLMDSGDPRIEHLVAANPDCPAHLLHRMAHRRDEGGEDLGLSVANNLSVESNTLIHLSEHPDPAVRLSVAMNHKTPVVVLNDMSNDSDESVSDAAWTNIRNRRNFG